MKLKTLIEYQRCFEMLKSADLTHKSLDSTKYLECLKAKRAFEFQLGLVLNKLPAVEVEGEAA